MTELICSSCGFPNGEPAGDAVHVVGKAMGELRTWRQRYAQYSELSTAVERVDEALAAVA